MAKLNQDIYGAFTAIEPTKEDKYRTEVNSEGEMMEMCHYEDCNGDAVIDAWDWASIKLAHTDYPEKPGKDVVYIQYG